MGVYIKDPSDVLDYGFNWASWLASGETISTSTWTVDDGITKDSQSKTNTISKVWLSGGTAGTNYKAVNTIVTSGGRTKQLTHIIRVKN